MNKIVIEFPVKGEWITPNSPRNRVPSHGTEMFGETYAIDFVMIKDEKRKAYNKSLLKYLLSGIELKDFYGWGQNVYSPVNGVVIATKDKMPERNKVHLYDDYSHMKRVTKDFMKGKGTIESVAGNYVLIKCSDEVYVLLAHLKNTTVCVNVGQTVTVNQVIGKLGHSGNSMMPHLHMQLMNDRDYRKAKGIEFVFREYEVKWRNGWEIVRNSIPGSTEIIRNK